MRHNAHFPNRSLCVPVLESVSTRTSPLNAVDQKPVGLNVALPVSTPVAGQVMISVLRRQRVSHCKRFNHSFKKLDLQSALDCQLVILLERRGRLDGQLCLSHFFRSAKSSSRSL